MIDTLDALRAVNLLMRLVIVIQCCVAWRRRSGLDRLWVVAPLSYALNGTIYYVLILSGLLVDAATISVLSSSLGLHVGLLIIGGVGLFLLPIGGRKESNK